MGAPSTSARRVPPAAIGLGLGVLALALRLSTINHEALWLDEGYTLLFSGLPFPQLLTVGGAHEHPPLYYLIVHFLRSVDNWYLMPRLVSAVAGSLVVVAVFFLAGYLYGRTAGILAASFVAIAPIHVWYGQDGRGYEIATLAVVLSYLTLFHALDEGRRWWALYSVATAACLYSEYTTAFALVPQLFLAVRAYRCGRLRPLLLSWGAAALLFAPWIGVLVGNASQVVSSYWIPHPTFSTLATTTMEFLGLLTPCPEDPCQGVLAPIPGLTTAVTTLTTMLIVAVLLLTVIAVVRGKDRAYTLALWLWLPFAIVIILAYRRPLYIDRIFLDDTPALYILVAAGLTWLGSHLRAAYSLILPIVLVSSLSLANIAQAHSNPDWRSAARDFASAYRPGQSVIFYPGVTASIVHAYLPGWHATYERPLWYRTYLDVPGWQKRYANTADPRLRVMQIRAAAAHGSAVWLLAQDYTGLNRARHWFVAHNYQLVLSEMYENDTRIELWSRKGPAALGKTVLSPGFKTGWTKFGKAAINGATLRLNGRAEAQRHFRVVPGATYFVNVAYRAFPPSSPSIQVFLRDAQGRPVATYDDRYGRLMDAFPRTQWYDLPVSGVWLKQPFGFVAPPGAARATIVIKNRWGQVDWRSVGVYRER